MQNDNKYTGKSAFVYLLMAIPFYVIKKLRFATRRWSKFIFTFSL